MNFNHQISTHAFIATNFNNTTNKPCNHVLLKYKTQRVTGNINYQANCQRVVQFWKEFGLVLRQLEKGWMTNHLLLNGSQISNQMKMRIPLKQFAFIKKLINQKGKSQRIDRIPTDPNSIKVSFYSLIKGFLSKNSVLV